ncbi:GGDEF domain-containing protein [Mycolicibacterium sp. CBM1]
MSTADNSLGWLAAGEVPAFLCRRTRNGVEITSTTPALRAANGPDSAWPSESVLLPMLESAWPHAAGPPVVTHPAEQPDHQCVLYALDDPPTACVGILRTMTPLQRYNESFFTTVQALPDIVARLDRHHRHLYVNPTIEKVTGIPAQAFIAKSKRELGLPPEVVEQWEALIDNVLHSGAAAELEHELPTVHGPRHFLTRAVPEFGTGGVVQTVLSTSHDITQLKSLQHQLAILASSDPLTSLLNRRGFIERVESELVRTRSGDGQLSLLLLDVNNFKSVNDTYGHIAGDNVLMAIADVLVQEIGPDDFAARIGGDEFCVGLVDGNATHAPDIAERIRRRVGELGARDLCPCGVSVSLGITSAAEADHSVADLIARVDESMYREKVRRPDQP